jgi:hypothetical protein
MHKSATKCDETLGKWCKNKHGASKIIDTFEMYQRFAKVKHGLSMRQVNPNKKSKEKTTIICSHIIKTTHDSFKGTLSILSHLRQFMLQQKLLSILSK